MEKQLIDIAYDLAKTKYAKKAFTFKQLWKELIKKAKLDPQEQKEVGHVYTCMLQDHRFIFIGNDEWKIREFLTLEQQAEYSNALYDFAKDNETAKPKDEEYGSDFDFDEDDEYKQHTEASLDDEEDEEDEIDNESESNNSDDEDEESDEDKKDEE